MDPNLALEWDDDLQKKEEVPPRRYCLNDPPEACWELKECSDEEIAGALHVVGPIGLKGEPIRALALKAVDAHSKNHGENLKPGDVLRAYEFEKTYLAEEFYLAYVVKDEEGNSKFVKAWVDDDDTPSDDLVPIYFP